jgi:hypothetical protein
VRDDVKDVDWRRAKNSAPTWCPLSVQIELLPVAKVG